MIPAEALVPYVIGIVLSLGVALFARRVGLDRDRAFYATVLIVVGSYYVLFAAMADSMPTLLVELLVMAVFSTVAVWGFKTSPWIVAAGLAAHGVFDGFHGFIVDNPGMPIWWPAFCGAYDVGAGAILAWMLKQRPAAPAPQPASV